jgi:hypothetical protein
MLPVVRHQGGVIDLEVVEDTRDIASLCFLVEAAGWLGGEPGPRRSGTTTNWSWARSDANGTHMSPVSP